MRTNGTMTTQSKTSTTTADYAGDGLTMSVTYAEDAITSTLTSLSGRIYKSATGTPQDRSYMGEFTGNLEGEEIKYTIQNVKSGDMPAVIAAIEDVESIIREQEQPVNPTE